MNSVHTEQCSASKQCSACALPWYSQSLLWASYIKAEIPWADQIQWSYKGDTIRRKHCHGKLLKDSHLAGICGGMNLFLTG